MFSVSLPHRPGEVEEKVWLGDGLDGLHKGRAGRPIYTYSTHSSDIGTHNVCITEIAETRSCHTFLIFLEVFDIVR